MAHFPRHFQYFASKRNTRYEWVRTGPIAALEPIATRKARFGTILSSARSFL